MAQKKKLIIHNNYTNVENLVSLRCLFKKKKKKSIFAYTHALGMEKQNGFEQRIASIWRHFKLLSTISLFSISELLCYCWNV